MVYDKQIIEEGPSGMDLSLLLDCIRLTNSTKTRRKKNKKKKK
jgi:hypothetical protein